MHKDDGKPNTKSAVPATWDVAEAKARGISARAASDQPDHPDAINYRSQRASREEPPTQRQSAVAPSQVNSPVA